MYQQQRVVNGARSAALGAFFGRLAGAPFPARPVVAAPAPAERAPDLDAQAVRALIERLAAAMDPAQEYEVRHEDCTIEFPQSGERFDRDGIRRLQESFPGEPPDIRVRRVTGAGDVYTCESVVRYADGTLCHGVGVIEFRDGRICRETRYFGEPFDPPSWRPDQRSER